MKWYAPIFFVLLLCSQSLPAYGAKSQLIFLYPGGQGSQAQAQPILDSFSEALKKASGGKIDATIQYFSNLQAGERFIQNQKPIGGILAWDLYEQKGSPWQADILLQTLQLPTADGKNQYFIVGTADQPLPTSGAITLESSRPLAKDFVKKIFPKLALEVDVRSTPNVVGVLRKIGKGEMKGWVLLDQFQYQHIQKLKSAWAKNIKAAATSQIIPSAPFVVFKPNLSDDQIQALKKALLKLSKDSKAQETLQLLRLKGFR